MLITYMKVHPFDSKGKKLTKYFYNFKWDQFDFFDEKFTNDLKEREIFEFETEVGDFKKRYNLKDCENWAKDNNRDFATMKLNHTNLFKEDHRSVLVNIPYTDHVTKEKIGTTMKRIYDAHGERFLKLDAKLYEKLGFSKLKIGDVVWCSNGKITKIFSVEETVLDEVSARKIHNIASSFSPHVFIDNSVKTLPVFKIEKE